MRSFHFYLEMCFAPQRRALFRHLNFQKCKEIQPCAVKAVEPLCLTEVKTLNPRVLPVLPGPPGCSELVLNGAFLSFGLPERHSKLQKRANELKMSENGLRLDASDREKSALRSAPASLQDFRVSRSARHSAFKELFWAL